MLRKSLHIHTVHVVSYSQFSVNLPFTSRSDCIKSLWTTSKSVPFVLRDKSTPTVVGSVLVSEPLLASNLQQELDITYDTFEPNKSNILKRAYQYILGDVLLGKQKTEQMLKVGTNLIGIGEVFLQGNLIVLTPPKNGSKYILSLLTKQEIIKNMEKQTLGRRFILKMLGWISIGVFAYSIYKLLNRPTQPENNFQHRIRWDIEDEIPHWNHDPVEHNQAEIQNNQPEIQNNQPGIQNNQPEIQNNQPEIQNNQPEIQNNQHEIVFIREEPECVICFSAPMAVVLIPCGHICLCRDCANALHRPKLCPICRRRVTKIQPYFHA
ncbi:unnamed protein product [Owenia fusiformis]|uniref:RING-type E3 ubiquitin transferase n=1 Tax=Owenia fusiformis TaxID=6347 RepID=A0A8J1YAP3_OWEFU|nr:unnamed protein product [Owenia fusiformis]